MIFWGLFVSWQLNVLQNNRSVEKENLKEAAKVGPKKSNKDSERTLFPFLSSCYWSGVVTQRYNQERRTRRTEKGTLREREKHNRDEEIFKRNKTLFFRGEPSFLLETRMEQELEGWGEVMREDPKPRKAKP